MLSNSVVSSNVGTVGSGDWSTLFKSIPVISTSKGTFDASADIFHFTLPGLSGDFLMLDSGQFQVFNTSEPFGTVTVSRLGTQEYEITTSDGTRYIFGTDGTLDWSAATTTFLRVAAYKLRQIVAPNGRTATFIYRKQYQVNLSEGLTILDSPTTMPLTSISYTNLLTGISIDGHQVASFAYSEKTDQEYPWQEVSRISNGYHMAIDPEKRLSAITIYNQNGETVQRADLTQVYVTESGGSLSRMFLSEVNLLQEGKFSFSYNATAGELPGYDCHAIDHWGFWNGTTVSMTSRDNYNPIDNGLYKQYDNVWKSIYTTIIRTTRDPSLEHTKKGALTSIAYPGGGSTEVEYEGNSASYLFDRSSTGVGTDRWNDFGFKVGGVRVKKLTDVSGNSRYPVTFRYGFGNGSNPLYSSGILFEMPRYGVGVMCWDYTSEGPSSGKATSFGNQSTPVTAQSAFIGYSYVITTYPDGSTKETRFFNDDDEYPEDLNEHVWLNGRYGFGDEDEILYNLFTTPCVDRSCIRGKLSQEIWYDSEGEISREVDYTYSFYTISEQMRLVNMVNCLTYQDFSIDYPELTSVTMIDHGLSTSSSYSYDALGRKVGEEINNGLFGSHISRTFTYDSKFKGSIASQAEVKTRSHVLDSDESTMTYTYDHSGKNRIPVSIVETHGGTSRTTTIQCNTKYRPVRINYPGRRWTQYMWNSEGSQLLGNTTNAAGNTTSYTWKDIARLKSVTMPTGLSESYDYDSHSRMSGRRDSDGRLIQSYEYHLLNE